MPAFGESAPVLPPLGAQEPEKYIKDVAEAGGDQASFHIEVGGGGGCGAAGGVVWSGVEWCLAGGGVVTGLALVGWWSVERPARSSRRHTPCHQLPHPTHQHPMRCPRPRTLTLNSHPHPCSTPQVMPSTQAAAELAAKIRALGMRAGVALAPDTGIEQVGRAAAAAAAAAAVAAPLGFWLLSVHHPAEVRLLCTSCAAICWSLWGQGWPRLAWLA